MKVVKILWYFSMLALLFLVVYGYRMLPNEIAISAEGTDMTSSSFFLIIMAMAVTLNATFIIAGRFIPLVKPSKLILPKKSRWISERKYLQKYYREAREWLRGYAIIFNLLAIFIMYAMSYYHEDMSENPTYNQGWIFFLIPGFIVGWTLFYFVYFSQTAPAKNHE